MTVHVHTPSCMEYVLNITDHAASLLLHLMELARSEIGDGRCRYLELLLYPEVGMRIVRYGNTDDGWCFHPPEHLFTRELSDRAYDTVYRLLLRIEADSTKLFVAEYENVDYGRDAQYHGFGMYHGDLENLCRLLQQEPSARLEAEAWDAQYYI